MIDKTLIIWGGEFGLTVYSQGGLSKENSGRDCNQAHHGLTSSTPVGSKSATLRVMR